MYKIIFPVLMLWLISCGEKSSVNDAAKLNALAEQYVRLGLTIGQYDADFVDAYYGPDSLKPTAAPDAAFPKDSLLAAVDTLRNALNSFSNNDTLSKRAAWIQAQLKAFERRIKIFAGEASTFDEESKDLYGVSAPLYDSLHYKQIVARLDSLLRGKGSINDRFQQLANHFIIPKDKLDTVFKTAIAECRKRTMQHYTLPAEENFSLEYVNNKPWGGYNWYKGNYRSVIQINTDLQIFIDRAIDVGSHESYPGHHVYNMLLEKNLYRDKGWVEISLYPLFSPQSLIAEGSANYGIAVAFPGDEKVTFAKNVLLPLAGLDTTGIDLYFKALELKDELNYARNEVGRGLLNNSMTEAQAIQWLEDYCLMNDETAKKSIDFIRKNRSYIINYNYGKDLVGQYITAKGGDASAEKKWEVFGELLSNEVMTTDLVK
ncbi:hypothetical protein FRZ67_03940 [Panacibacter ginsenosidivorans]|uniref:DUF885 domain-containing protein n=1 Tax=Panacibacter ginsenosidivorans TaxID=1813871 RepID=A0A5B8V530_9BACT|nr:hypothetical protein [Panacibacter ginsenosidivorans]QEC66484.1 hypothetical protein FRZ67_03940 [Panacibacter ginsenosidivorans]